MCDRMTKEKDRKRDTEKGRGNHGNMKRHRDSLANRGERFDERIIHDEEFGEENVELVDSDWADFERALR